MNPRESSERPMCATWGHENVPAVRYVSCEGEGVHPYCGPCSDLLLRGDEIDRGPVERVTEAMVDRALAASRPADPHNPGSREWMREILEAALAVSGRESHRD